MALATQNTLDDIAQFLERAQVGPAAVSGTHVLVCRQIDCVPDHAICWPTMVLRVHVATMLQHELTFPITLVLLRSIVSLVLLCSGLAELARPHSHHSVPGSVCCGLCPGAAAGTANPHVPGCAVCAAATQLEVRT